MPLDYLRSFTGPERSAETNRRLGRWLAFVAGATNAGGFLAVGQYTSHMSGVVSSIADQLMLGRFDAVAAALLSLFAFLSGAACSAILINWGRRRRAQSAFALPLMMEAGLLLAFGVLGPMAQARISLPAALLGTIALLCYVMGLQNAMITKISKAEIRTTHVTGLVTDIGIELGKLLYRNDPAVGMPPVHADRRRLRLLASLLAMFLAGGVAGAFGFAHLGFVATLPLAAILLLLAAVPVFDDLGHRRV